jgi:two-component system sensor histidine kinase HydH
MIPEVFQSPDQRRTPSTRRIRVGFLIVGLTLAVVLVAVTLSAYLSARALAETVTRGQGAMILNALGDIAHPGHGPDPDEAELATMVESLDEELGISYVEVHYRDRPGPTWGVQSRALSGQEIRETVRAGLGRDGDLARVIIPLGPLEAPGSESLPPPSDAPALQGRGPRGHLIIEFEPVLAAKLSGGALRELAVGVTGAAIMILASLVFWRLSLASERAEQRHAQQRQLAALGEMSAVLAHELRNPLASLKGHAQLLQERLERDGANERTTSKAARVVAEARRLEELTHGLLAFVRVGELIRSPASPLAIVEGAIADLARERVTIVAEHAPASWSLDAQRMQQVISNLVDNALQAAPDERVEVEIRQVARTCVFEVRDRGPGVPADQRELIFEPFHTTRIRGTGLGLAVSRRIVELHDGMITVEQNSARSPGREDNSGGGALFRVTIPQERGRT